MIKTIKSHYISTLTAILLVVVVAGCNDDVFLDPIVTETDSVVLTEVDQEVSVDVSGSDWRIINVHSGSDIDAGYDGGSIYFVSSPLLAFSIEKKGDNELLFKLKYNITNEARGFYVTVGNRYEEQVIGLTIAPTGKLEFAGIDYVLTSWAEYPGENTTDELEGYTYLNGFDKDEFYFPPISTMPAVYRFEPIVNSDMAEIANAICNCGATVPIPSPTPYDYPTWGLLGDTATLTTSQSATELNHFVTPQSSLQVPKGVPISISRLCDYGSYAFQCTISVRNPVTDETIEIISKLRILMPVKIYGTYKLL